MAGSSAQEYVSESETVLKHDCRAQASEFCRFFFFIMIFKKPLSVQDAQSTSWPRRWRSSSTSSRGPGTWTMCQAVAGQVGLPVIVSFVTLPESLAPLMALEMSTGERYNCFYAINTKFLLKDLTPTSYVLLCWSFITLSSPAFQLLRLLLQYHDPQLCAFLDSKRISPDQYSAPWVGSRV